ncbi:MAG: YtxH domain-containing protein [Microgenomates group bacterium]
MKNNSSSDSGSFVTGFTIGLFAGAVGYYLFASKKGTTLLKKVTSEWEKAQKQFPEEITETLSNVNIRSLITNAVDSISKVFESATQSVNESITSVPKVSEIEKQTPKRRKSSKAQFKNRD